MSKYYDKTQPPSSASFFRLRPGQGVFSRLACSLQSWSALRLRGSVIRGADGGIWDAVDSWYVADPCVPNLVTVTFAVSQTREAGFDASVLRPPRGTGCVDGGFVAGYAGVWTGRCSATVWTGGFQSLKRFKYAAVQTLVPRMVARALLPPA